MHCFKLYIYSVCIYSLALRIFIDHIVKTLLKRIDSASLAIADFMNAELFGPNGPVNALCDVMGTTRGKCVLRRILPKHHTGPVVPRKESEHSKLYLPKHADDHLVLAFGFLRRFDATQNGVTPNDAPQCSFSNSQPIRGMNKLDQYGPLSFEFLYCVASGLGGMFQSTICGVDSVSSVARALSVQLHM
jgi:hypothetical protein